MDANKKNKEHLVEMGTSAFYTSIKTRTNSAVDAYAEYLRNNMLQNLREKLQENLVETPLLESLERFEQYYEKTVGEKASTKTKMGLLSRLVARMFGEKEVIDTPDPNEFVKRLTPQDYGINIKRDFVGEVEQSTARNIIQEAKDKLKIKEIEKAIGRNILARINQDPDFEVLKRYNMVPTKHIARVTREKIKLKLLEIPKAHSPNLKRELANDIVMDVFKAMVIQRISEAKSQQELEAIKAAFTQFLREYHYEKLKEKDLHAINSFIETEETRKYKRLFESSPEAKKIKKEYEQILALICLRNEELLKKEYRGLKKLRFLLTSVCKKLGLGHNDVVKEMQKLKKEVQKQHIKTIPLYKEVQKSRTVPIYDFSSIKETPKVQQPQVTTARPKVQKNVVPLFNSPRIYDSPSSSEREVFYDGR